MRGTWGTCSAAFLRDPKRDSSVNRAYYQRRPPKSVAQTFLSVLLAPAKMLSSPNRLVKKQLIPAVSHIYVVSTN